MQRLLIALAAAALLLAGCGSGDDTAEDTSTDHNAADVMFTQMMIPHHEQAVEMSDLAATRASDPQVTQLAARIKAAQQPEIDQMTAWLKQWDEPVMMDGEHAEHMMMDGMLDEAQMSALEAADGAAFDRLYLEGLIEHHEGAVDMANTVLEDGMSAEVAELAKAIVASQTAEIDQMRTWLA